MSKLRPTPAFMKRLEFLSSGRLYLKDAVKSITFSYTIRGEGSSGVRRFIAEKLPPIQFKNPDVQMVTFKSATPTPFVKIYFADKANRKVTLDVEGKEPDRILKEISAVAGKLESQVMRAQQEAEYNPANFGDSRRGRLCICEVPGQVPCPSRVPIENVEHKWHDKK